MVLRLIFLLGLLVSLRLSAQEDEIYKAISIPPIDIFASDAEWTNDSIIQKIITDTTFYQSFLNMKYFPHSIEGQLEVYFRNDKSKAKMSRIALQKLENKLKWVEVSKEETNGKIRKKNGKYKYLTAEMYDEVFFPTHKHEVSNSIVSLEQEETKESKIEKYKSQLKKMLFNPGAPIESVPFIGNKLEIFSDKMVPFYNYSIFTSRLKDSTECLVFKLEAKPEFRKNKTVIKSMTTYFNKETFQVLDRTYHLKYNHSLFQFDINMKIENTVQSGYLVPKKIEYSGWWDIPIKSAEIIDFNLKCTNYTFEE